jgi:Fe-S cluster assembly ATP-binding protein
VHVFVDGRIVEQGGPELAERLEARAYDRFTGRPPGGGSAGRRRDCGAGA